MKYYEVEFTISPLSQDARDILSAMAGEAGFETFEDSPTGLTGYIQQPLFDASALDSVVSSFPIDGISIIYNVREADYQDWNQQWEQEGFEPIVIGRQLFIHDGRHLGDTDLSTFSCAVEIDARLAFGTGTHETTRMICSTLLQQPFRQHAATGSPLHVLDCGCGTGILGICALKLGAARCTAYDIDEWSVDNTRHNSVINHVDHLMTILHGDATLLDSLTDRFQLVMANINRNILLEDLPRFVNIMSPDAKLILSGFYRTDCQQLTDKAQHLGLTLQGEQHDGEWACLLFSNNQHSTQH